MNDQKNTATNNIEDDAPHAFHIPVMGIGFTIDSPLRVAKYGISSVISLVDDILIEQIRKVYCKKEGEPYEEIHSSDNDARARRITEYLNLVDRVVKRQVKHLQASPFEKNSEISKYYTMLPDGELKAKYTDMQNTSDPEEKLRKQDELRKLAVPGSIDVNIMTKLDKAKVEHGHTLSVEFNDAFSAFRGYAESNLKSAIVFSAGLNKQLYSYMTKFKDFFADTNNNIKKKIVLKVSDYRSALIQGKFLAKKGLWVSEYRVESGLNCGGHTFATKGYLLGPILDEFRKKKEELTEYLHDIYDTAVKALYLPSTGNPNKLKITVQGGIVSSDEQQLMMNHYQVDSTGWGTPFMLVSEAVTMDAECLDKLASASRQDAVLSSNSPLCLPFWSLRNSPSEELRRKYIEEDHPGRPCKKGYLANNTEFTDKLKPLCVSSRTYQTLKLKDIENGDNSPEQIEFMKEQLLEKACLCTDLGGTAERLYEINKDATPAICCGPSIGYFSQTMSLETMINHIYGRLSLLNDAPRSHMFIEELKIYIEHLGNEIHKLKLHIVPEQRAKYLTEFKENLLEGISYYKELAAELLDEQREKFLEELTALQELLDNTSMPVPIKAPCPTLPCG